MIMIDSFSSTKRYGGRHLSPSKESWNLGLRVSHTISNFKMSSIMSRYLTYNKSGALGKEIKTRDGIFNCDQELNIV